MIGSYWVAHHLAFINPRLGIAMWFPAFPLGRLLDRRRPAGAERYLA